MNQISKMNPEMRQIANDTKQEHVLAEEKVAVVRTKQHEKQKQTGIRTEKEKKRRKQGKKARKS